MHVSGSSRVCAHGPGVADARVWRGRSQLELGRGGGDPQRRAGGGVGRIPCLREGVLWGGHMPFWQDCHFGIYGIEGVRRGAREVRRLGRGGFAGEAMCDL